VSRRVGLPAALLVPMLAAAATAAVLAGPVAEILPAAAQAQNRAAVIVNTGGGTAAVCVRFPEPTITGLDALQRTGLGAVVRSFGGQGAAVCGLNGVGCPADDSCLTCQAPNYWAYHRAGPGAGGFTLSAAGAGSTAVSDGSVEGWQWGTGAPPPFQTVDQVCGPAAARSPAEPAPSAGRVAPEPIAPAGGGDGSTPDGPADRASPPTDPVATTTIGPTTTGTGPEPGDAAAGPAAAGDPLDGQLASADRGRTDDGASPWAVGLFVVLVAGVGTAAVIIRRRRAV
jgi:hypothetical protein